MTASRCTIGCTTITFLMNMNGVDPHRCILNLNNERNCITVLGKNRGPDKSLPLAGPMTAVACFEGIGGIPASRIKPQLTKAIETPINISNDKVFIPKQAKLFFILESSLIKCKLHALAYEETLPYTKTDDLAIISNVG